MSLQRPTVFNVRPLRPRVQLFVRPAKLNPRTKLACVCKVLTSTVSNRFVLGFSFVCGLQPHAKLNPSTPLACVYQDLQLGPFLSISTLAKLKGEKSISHAWAPPYHSPTTTLGPTLSMRTQAKPEGEEKCFAFMGATVPTPSHHTGADLINKDTSKA